MSSEYLSEEEQDLLSRLDSIAGLTPGLRELFSDLVFNQNLFSAEYRLAKINQTQPKAEEYLISEVAAALNDPNDINIERMIATIWLAEHANFISPLDRRNLLGEIYDFYPDINEDLPGEVRDKVSRLLQV